MKSLTGLELIHLDQYYWKPNWKESNALEWKMVVEELVWGNSWIIDGNYAGTLDIRLSRADTIIYLDYPTGKCLFRVLRRTFKYFGKVRPDMPEGCAERFDLDFLHYVLTFNLRNRRSLLRKLSLVAKDKVFNRLKNDKEVQMFFREFSTT